VKTNGGGTCLILWVSQEHSEIDTQIPEVDLHSDRAMYELLAFYPCRSPLPRETNHPRSLVSISSSLWRCYSYQEPTTKIARTCGPCIEHHQAKCRF